MAIKPNDLSAIIKAQIKNFEQDVFFNEAGRVITVGDGIALVSGLENVEYGELVKFESGVFGMALSFSWYCCFRIWSFNCWNWPCLSYQTSYFNICWWCFIRQSC